MNDVIHAAAELQKVCLAHEWRFCFIGGVALQRWGEPRQTVDADLSLLTGFGAGEEFARILLQHFEGRIPNAAQFALDRRVLLLRSPGGVGLDVAFAGLPFEESMIARSSLFEYPTKTLLRTCSAEDLIVLKAFAARGQDWVDIERILIRQGSSLDWGHILLQIRPLAELKEAPEILGQLLRLRDEFGQ